MYSKDGRFFAWASPEQVNVVDASIGAVVTSLPADNVYELGFSPNGTYIITWQRPTKDEDGNATKNLKVWRTIDENAGAEGERAVVGKFVQKNQTGWNLQYTSDEQFCARCVTNEVQFYESKDLGTVWNKLRVEGVNDFALAPGKNHSVAVFVPERKVSCLEWEVEELECDILTPTCRDLPPRSRSSPSRNSMHRSLRRPFSRATRSR